MVFGRFHANAVVTAKHFNPSLLRDFWLVDNGVLSRDDFMPGCVHTDAFVSIIARPFSLLVAPDRLQFEPSGSAEHHQSTVVDKLGKIVRTLPHTPFTALGLNFTWYLQIPEEATVEEVTRAMFSAPDQIPLQRQFLEPNAKFGIYCSKDALGFRLRLDIKPIEIDTNDTIQFAFNFHRGFSGQGSGADEVVEAIEKWDESHNLSWEMLSESVEREAGHARAF